jgi:hypothetical protein
MIPRIGVLLLAASCASAATYYVATTGNDGNSGSSAKPWKTLQHAVNMVSPGATILVEAGTYAGCRIGVSGSTTLPKTLEAAPGLPRS